MAAEKKKTMAAQKGLQILASSPKTTAVEAPRDRREDSASSMVQHEGESKTIHDTTSATGSSTRSRSTSSSRDSEATRTHLQSLEALEAGNLTIETQKYHEEEIEDMPMVPGNDESAWGYHGQRRRRPVAAKSQEDWVQEADNLESGIGSAAGTRYYCVDRD